MSDTRFEKLSVVVIKDAPAEPWTAVALELDVVTCGDTFPEALQLLTEAVVTLLVDDANAGLDPYERTQAPEDLWRVYHHVRGTGRRIPTEDIDGMATSSFAVATEIETWVRMPTLSLPLPEPTRRTPERHPAKVQMPVSVFAAHERYAAK